MGEADQFAELQWAFDHLDADNSGSLSQEELVPVLAKFLNPPPTAREMQELFRAINLNSNGEVNFDEFLKIMSMVSAGKGVFSRAMPFTLRGVSSEKLRELLKLFSISDKYIQ